MFNISVPELLLILIVALIVFGPKQLSELAKNLGRLFGKMRRSSQDLINTLQTDKNPKKDSKSKSNE